MQPLKARITSYEDICDPRLMPRVPLIINLNGRNFSKITSLLPKPFSLELGQCLYATMADLVQEIEGAVFAYSFNDEITIIVRNDQTLDTQPWYDNSVSKIISAASSLATLHFNDAAAELEVNLSGDPIFLSKIFTVPNLTEAVNVMVYHQQRAHQIAVRLACFYELIKKYRKHEIEEMLMDTSLEEKIKLLKEEAGIDFYEYPVEFRRGVVCYRRPETINYNGEDIVKERWALNTDVPIFTSEKEFLQDIIKKH
jgi:tRNA(His) 5'-end guanylyltransferase